MWARQRQFIIILLLGISAIIVVGFIGYKLFYKAPICTDGKQDGKEEGIDCGGPCPYLCAVSEAPLQVRFARPINPAPGRTDFIAYVDNANANAGVQHAKYTMEVYGADQNLITRKVGTMTIPPSSTVPLYIPRVYEGGEAVSEAFLTFSSSSIAWLRAEGKPVVPVPASIQVSNGPHPRVIAELHNTVAHAYANLVVVATVFDANGNAIAASQTVVPTLPPQGNAPLTFTWNQPFSSAPARVEILPTYGS